MPTSFIKCPSSPAPADSSPPPVINSLEPEAAPAGCRRVLTFKFSDRQYLNILPSVGQSVHATDTSGRIIYWLVFPAEVLPLFPNLVQDLFHSSRLKIDNGLTLEHVDQEDTKAHESGSPIYQRRKMPFIVSSGSEKHCREC